MSDPNPSNVCGGANCNQDPIRVCTSLPILPMSGTPTNFDEDCRDLAELMCLAVVRYMEEYNRKYRTTPNPALPSKLESWKLWAKGLSATQPGLPDCINRAVASVALGESMTPDVSAQSQPSTTSAAEYTNRTYDAVQTFGAVLAAYDINDWHDD